jgi:hypothetical protein
LHRRKGDAVGTGPVVALLTADRSDVELNLNQSGARLDGSHRAAAEPTSRSSEPAELFLLHLPRRRHVRGGLQMADLGPVSRFKMA